MQSIPSNRYVHPSRIQNITAPINRFGIHGGPQFIHPSRLQNFEVPESNLGLPTAVSFIHPSRLQNFPTSRNTSAVDNIFGLQNIHQSRLKFFDNSFQAPDTSTLPLDKKLTTVEVQERRHRHSIPVSTRYSAQFKKNDFVTAPRSNELLHFICKQCGSRWSSSKIHTRTVSRVCFQCGKTVWCEGVKDRSILLEARNQTVLLESDPKRVTVYAKPIASIQNDHFNPFSTN
jgi:hypothetical protein